MTSYVPILRAREAELQAWQHVDRRVPSHARPIFELVPEGKRTGPVAFVNHVKKHWTTPGLVTFDLGTLRHSMSARRAADTVDHVANALWGGCIEARPVVQIGDPPGVLDLASTAHRELGVGVAARLRLDDGQEPADLMLLMAGTDVTVEDVDLVLDCGHLADAAATARAVVIATDALAWAARQGIWRSVTLAAGAFPTSIGELPKGRPTRLRRLDAQLWSKVAGGPVQPHFGDRGIAGPPFAGPSFRGPLPNLRYAFAEDWWVWREERGLPGSEPVRTLCGRVVDSEAWRASGFSWGDSQIARCADGRGGPGNATSWLAWATSHHLATVTERLGRLGVP